MKHAQGEREVTAAGGNNNTPGVIIPGRHHKECRQPLLNCLRVGGRSCCGTTIRAACCRGGSEPTLLPVRKEKMRGVPPRIHAWSQKESSDRTADSNRPCNMTAGPKLARFRSGAHCRTPTRQPHTASTQWTPQRRSCGRKTSMSWSCGGEVPSCQREHPGVNKLLPQVRLRCP